MTGPRDRDRLRPGEARMTTPDEANRRKQPGEGGIQAIIVEAQESAMKFVDEARRQADLIVRQAREETKQRSSEALRDARGRVDSLVETAERMLEGVDRLSTELTEVTETLREASQRIRDHVGELVDEEPDESTRHRRRGLRH